MTSIVSHQVNADQHALIDDAMNRYHTDQVYAAFSGGHDSLASTHLASLHPCFRGVVHINTTIGVPETRTFVRSTCEQYGWPLHVAQPTKAWGYVQMVLRFGFPGPAQHRMMYQSLKHRPLSALLTTLRETPGQNIILCTGMRQQESARRMGLTDNVRKEKNIIWVSPIFDWTATDVTNYVSKHELKRNPVKDNLHISGECLCGCFADTDERQELAIWYPHVNEELLKIERLLEYAQSLNLQDYRYPAHTSRWGWGAGNKLEQIVDADPLPMCHFCTYGRYEKLQEQGNVPLFASS